MHETTTPYTLQQNGRIECFTCTVMILLRSACTCKLGGSFLGVCCITLCRYAQLDCKSACQETTVHSVPGLCCSYSYVTSSSGKRVFSLGSSCACYPLRVWLGQTRNNTWNMDGLISYTVASYTDRTISLRRDGYSCCTEVPCPEGLKSRPLARLQLNFMLLARLQGQRISQQTAEGTTEALGRTSSA